MTQIPRVALLCETFHEINGVALTARQLVAYARRHNYPMLAIHGGLNPGTFEEGSVRRIEIKRGWASIGIERDLEYDPFFWRFHNRIRKELLAFKPDVIHITSPGELGKLGAYLSRSISIPLVASWHTNFHQFAGRRLQKLLGFLPKSTSDSIVDWSQEKGLRILLWFYGHARVTLAPTLEQVRWLEETLKKPAFLMTRGVDSEIFNPQHRTVKDGLLRLGFVGRITPEKGVRLFYEIERALEQRGFHDFLITMVGAGSEVDWLKRNLRHGDFLGVLRGEALSQAYANNPQTHPTHRTDTFGNVIQEAAASRVPSVVTNEGGPQHLVVPEITGIVAKDDEEFVRSVVELVTDRERLTRMGEAARERVAGVSWDAAFDLTYKAYEHCLPQATAQTTREEDLDSADVALRKAARN